MGQRECGKKDFRITLPGVESRDKTLALRVRNIRSELGSWTVAQAAGEKNSVAIR
jgi:hypothetical protein